MKLNVLLILVFFLTTNSNIALTADHSAAASAQGSVNHFLNVELGINSEKFLSELLEGHNDKTFINKVKLVVDEAVERETGLRDFIQGKSNPSINKLGAGLTANLIYSHLTLVQELLKLFAAKTVKSAKTEKGLKILFNKLIVLRQAEKDYLAGQTLADGTIIDANNKDHLRRAFTYAVATSSVGKSAEAQDSCVLNENAYSREKFADIHSLYKKLDSQLAGKDNKGTFYGLKFKQANINSYNLGLGKNICEDNIKFVARKLISSIYRDRDAGISAAEAAKVQSAYIAACSDFIKQDPIGKDSEKVTLISEEQKSEKRNDRTVTDADKDKNVIDDKKSNLPLLTDKVADTANVTDPNSTAVTVFQPKFRNPSASLLAIEDGSVTDPSNLALVPSIVPAKDKKETNRSSRFKNPLKNPFKNFNFGERARNLFKFKKKGERTKPIAKAEDSINNQDEEIDLKTFLRELKKKEDDKAASVANNSSKPNEKVTSNNDKKKRNWGWPKLNFKFSADKGGKPNTSTSSKKADEAKPTITNIDVSAKDVLPRLVVTEEPKKATDKPSIANETDDKKDHTIIRKSREEREEDVPRIAKPNEVILLGNGEPDKNTEPKVNAETRNKKRNLKLNFPWPKNWSLNFKFNRKANDKKSADVKSVDEVKPVVVDDIRPEVRTTEDVSDTVVGPVTTLVKREANEANIDLDNSAKRLLPTIALTDNKRSDKRLLLEDDQALVPANDKKENSLTEAEKVVIAEMNKLVKAEDTKTSKTNEVAVAPAKKKRNPFPSFNFKWGWKSKKKADSNAATATNNLKPANEDDIDTSGADLGKIDKRLRKTTFIGPNEKAYFEARY